MPDFTPTNADLTGADLSGAQGRNLEELWAQTVARGRTLDEELLHRRVDGQWSFIETLRHLVFATDACATWTR